MTTTAIQFFKWCSDRHLAAFSDIADYFFTTESYIAQLHRDMEKTPALCVEQWLSVALDVFDHFIGDNTSEDCLSLVPRTKPQFFAWCKERGLHQISQIAAAFRLSDQTVRNWERHVSKNEKLDLSYWCILTVFCYDTYIGDQTGDNAFSHVPTFGDMNFRQLKTWQNRHGLSTYQDTGDIFRIKRQAVHNWLTRGSLPEWLPMACEAINLLRAGKTRKTIKQVA